jgi:DNA-3-methyladenine glycosylase
LPKAFYARDALTVARDLIGCLFVHDGPAGRLGVRLVEVEAYRGTIDPGSHGYRGPTPRTETMYGPPGHLYVYFTYGMHWCANVVCDDDGVPGAVLLRGLTPLAGVEEMRRLRPRARADHDLCSGPAKLCQAFGLDRSFDGADLVSGDRGVSVADDGTPPPSVPARTGRIGLRVAADLPWRFYVPGAAGVSRRG